METKVKTSKKNWLDAALKAYIGKEAFTFKDNAKIGLTKDDLSSPVSLIKAAQKKANIPWKQIVGILAGLGISGIGLYLVLLAINDPEPTSKLGLLILGGISLLLTGSITTLASLGSLFSVSLKTPGGYEFKIAPINST